MWFNMYTHTYIHTHIHTSIHPYTHTYIHGYVLYCLYSQLSLLLWRSRKHLLTPKFSGVMWRVHWYFPLMLVVPLCSGELIQCVFVCVCVCLRQRFCPVLEILCHFWLVCKFCDWRWEVVARHWISHTHTHTHTHSTCCGVVIQVCTSAWLMGGPPGD